MFSKLRYRAATAYWKVFQPITIGVKVIITCEDKLLLVTQSYQSYWSLPGGGVEAGESVYEAAARELVEETSIKVSPASFMLRSIHFSKSEAKSDHIALLSTVCDVCHQPIINSELSKAGWFGLAELPNGVSPATMRRINEYSSKIEPDLKW